MTGPEEQHAGLQDPFATRPSDTAPEAPIIAPTLPGNPEDQDDVVAIGCDPATSTGGSGATFPTSARHFPRRVGKFNLLGAIAAGGMGVVYKAEELTQNRGRETCARVVALKQILPERMKSPEAVERFHREIKVAKTLEHPNIVQVFESGNWNGEYFFTMPFVTGGSLQKHVKDPAERLNPAQAAAVVRQVARGVEYAHGQGVIHRDIKPHNVLLQPDLRSSVDFEVSEVQVPFIARLSDFGLAKLVTEDSTLSMSQRGEAMGTPGYMPPEQAEGDKDVIGPASDIYSLGALLYALLTGRPPFPHQESASILEILRQVKEDEPGRLLELNPRATAGLEDICTRCLQKRPSDRYASVSQLIEALDDYLAGLDTLRHTPRRAGAVLRAVQRGVQLARRHPLRAGYLAASLGLIGLLLALLLIRSGLDPERNADEEAKKARAEHKASRFMSASDGFLKAQQGYEDALKNGSFVGSLLRPGGRSQLHQKMAQVAGERGTLLRRYPERWSDAEKALLLARDELEALPPDSGEAGRERRRLLGEAYHGLGALYGLDRKPEKLAQSVANYRKALAIRAKLADELPHSVDASRDLARNHGWLGDVLLDQRDWAGAREAYETAATIRQKVLALIPPEDTDALLDAHCQRARDFMNLGGYFERIGQRAEALAEYRRQLQYYEEHLDPKKPLPVDFRTDRAECLVALGDLELARRGATPETRAWLERARAEFDVLTGTSSEAAWCWIVWGKDLALAGEKGRAGPEFDKGLAELRSKKTPKPEDLFHQAVADAWKGRLAGPGAAAGPNALALRGLEDAVHQGFRNLDQVVREPGFEGLRGEQGFKLIVAHLEAER